MLSEINRIEDVLESVEESNRDKREKCKTRYLWIVCPAGECGPEKTKQGE